MPLKKKKAKNKKIRNKKAVKTTKKVKTKITKPIGVITHFYGGLKVGIAKFNRPVKLGASVHIKGATTDFKTKISSLQYNYKELKTAPKGKQIGIKFGKRVRVGDKIFEA